MKNKTDFITRCWISVKRVSCRFRLPEKLSGSLAALCLALWLPFGAHASEGISPSRYQAKITAEGRLSISSRFHITLPEALQDALQQGIALDFVLSYRLERPTILAYRFKISQLIGAENTLGYRLSFHPLTNRYRVSVGTFSTEYNRLESALKAIGAIANWEVFANGTLGDIEPSDIKAQIRLNLSTDRLPKPFQLNALTSDGWDLDSGWRDLDIQ